MSLLITHVDAISSTARNALKKLPHDTKLPLQYRQVTPLLKPEFGKRIPNWNTCIHEYAGNTRIPT